MRLFAVLIGLLAIPLGAGEAIADDKPKAEDDKVAPLKRFVGEWEVHGKWNTGQELHARAVYKWGLKGKILQAQTFVKDDKGEEYQRYESVMTWHPKKKSLYQVSFAFDGGMGEALIEAKDKDTLLIGFKPFNEGEASNLRQTIKFEGDDSFIWTVQVKEKEEWKQLIEATWKRKK